MLDRAWAAPIPELEGRLVRAVEVEGLVSVPLRLVENNLRMRAGGAYNADVVRGDITRLTQLDRFSGVEARVVQHADGDVTVVYVVREMPLLTDVQVVGNRSVSDNAVLREARLRAGDPADTFTIREAMMRIERLYRQRGHEFISVDYDREFLTRDNLLLFQVREGPRVRVRGIRFEGNQRLESDLIQRHIESRTALDVLFPIREGHLNSELVTGDEARIREFYRSRGFREAEVGSRIDISPDQRDAIITFIISEGEQFTVNRIEIQGHEVFTARQLLVGMELKPGDIFSTTAQNRARDAIVAMYHRLGHVRCAVDVEFVFVADEPKVNVLVQIDEGRSYTVGTVTIRGNQRTRTDVALHQIRRIEPGRVFDGTGIEATRERFQQSRLFGRPEVTLVDHPTEPDVLDVILQVEERQTGNFSFGGAASSDLGFGGHVTLTQRNFDIEDFPESFDALFRGQAFIGAGQFFRLHLAPGMRYSSYTVDWSEPNFLSTDFSLNLGGGFFQRDQRVYDEDRFNFRLGVGRAFGDVWSAGLRTRIEHIHVGNISPDGATDIFDVRGGNFLVGTSLGVSRSTVKFDPGARMLAVSGSRLGLEIEHVGLGVSDFSFTSFSANFAKYWTLDTDFLDRKTVLVFRSEIGYILPEGNAPIFERRFAGGQQSFRGFQFRGVGPRGVRDDTGGVTEDSIGGDFLFLAGLELTFPIYDQVLRGAVFTDTGTVQSGFGFDEYRVSVGFGLRVLVPFIQAPIAVDLGFPLIKQSTDQTQVFSISADFPF
ncbi:MAG: outer membrane protein assembly factor [Phycisphaeraceae bacterium]|nr:outer membrane protein assembly factor [Phycisphaeraceae bacterium]